MFRVYQDGKEIKNVGIKVKVYDLVDNNKSGTNDYELFGDVYSNNYMIVKLYSRDVVVASGTYLEEE